MSYLDMLARTWQFLHFKYINGTKIWVSEYIFFLSVFLGYFFLEIYFINDSNSWKAPQILQSFTIHSKS